MKTQEDSLLANDLEQHAWVRYAGIALVVLSMLKAVAFAAGYIYGSIQ